MRKVTFGGAISLDNFLARADHSVDWLMWCDEAAAVTAEYWKTIDTILMGRKTYEVALRLGGEAAPRSRGKHTYVFSRTLPSESHGELTIVSGDAAAFVDGLKRQPGKDICLMGGGELAASLFEARLIDEIRFSMHPVLLGAGIPLYHPMSRQNDLELLDVKIFKNGCVLASYRVKP